MAVLLILAVLPSRAQVPDSLSQEARVSVLTVDPGTPVYSLWGHSALRILDPGRGFDAVFNWGTFDPDLFVFTPRFAYGDMQYELSVEPMSGFLRGATLQERGVSEQVLTLDPVVAQTLWDLLRVNMEPANRAYAYDFVRDNCSTRILELLVAAGATGFAGEPADSTYRQQVDRFVHHQAWLDLGIDLAFGARMDRPVTAQDRAFLPLELEYVLESASTPAGEPLVRETRTLLERKWTQSEPGSDRVDLLFGAVALLILVYTVRTRRASGHGPLDHTLLFFFGGMGLFLLLMWVATLHWVTAWNLNLLWALPTHLVAAIVWTRWKGLSRYLRISAWVMLVGLAVQLSGVQPVPTAMALLAGATALRFLLLDRSAPTLPASESGSPAHSPSNP
ncbi:MAG: DUF4105 domain-containing protein [Bacteroidetes bacterium]|nr:DUF4105 domain-containing protein [Bacteroidota bacterium]